MSALKNQEINKTIRAVSYVKVIEVPSDFYVKFLKRNNIFYKIRDASDITSSYRIHACLGGSAFQVRSIVKLPIQ